MKKICLSSCWPGAYFVFRFCSAGGKRFIAIQKRKLNFEEANLVSSYYHQDGKILR